MEVFVRLFNAAPATVAARISPSSRVARALRPAMRRLLPSGPTDVVVRSGLARGAKLRIDPRHEKYYWTGLHDPEVQEALRATLGRGMTFWDVGAHIGFFTLLGSRLVGAEGRVHSFEPSPGSARRLLRTVNDNRLTNVDLHSIALSADDDDALLYESGSSLMATLDASHGLGSSTLVRCRTIDSLSLELGVPDVVKIDVERAELAVLRGGAATFARGRTTAIVELLDPERVGEALALLGKYGARRISDSNWVFTPGAR